MEIQTKTPTKTESQIGAYLMSDFPPLTLAYKGMADAVGNFVEATGDPEKTKSLIEEVNPRANRHDKDLVLRQYATFLKHLSPEKRTTIKQIESLFEAYQPFKASVSDIIQQQEESIGHGGFSVVFPLHRDGNDYAVRVPHRHTSQTALNEVHKHLEAAVLTADIPHMEHILAASYADGVTIAERAPGKNLSELSSHDANAITAEQLEDMLAAMQTAYERGVGFDFLGDNFLYDPKAGFTAIDVGLAKEREDDPMRSRPTVSLIESLRRCAKSERDIPKQLAIQQALKKLEHVMKQLTPDDSDAFMLIGRYKS